MVICGVTPSGDGTREWINFSSYQTTHSLSERSEPHSRRYTRRVVVSQPDSRPEDWSYEWVNSSYQEIVPVIEKQHYTVACGVGLSLYAPYTFVYQLCQLNPEKAVTKPHMLRLAARLLPMQLLLRYTQTNITGPVKEYVHPWAAFATIILLQAGVYCHCNMYFSKALGIINSNNSGNAFRGLAFGAPRDIISQAGPFLLSDLVRKLVFDQISPPNPFSESNSHLNQWAAVVSSSVTCTYISQVLHNGHIKMQADKSVGYIGAMKSLWERNGITAFYRGAEKRVGVLLIMNMFNEVLLKPAYRGG